MYILTTHDILWEQNLIFDSVNFKIQNISMPNSPTRRLYSTSINAILHWEQNWVNLTHLISLALVPKNTHIEESNWLTNPKVGHWQDSQCESSWLGLWVSMTHFWVSESIRLLNVGIFGTKLDSSNESNWPSFSLSVLSYLTTLVLNWILSQNR